MATPVPIQTIQQLGILMLAGEATQGGIDTAILATPGLVYARPSKDILNLATAWNTAEFNVFGDCCRSEANFNSGSTLVVRIMLVPGTPTCKSQGFTSETNNLYFVKAGISPNSGTTPAIIFTESSTPSTTNPCESAIGGAHTSGTVPEQTPH
jgi:predicted extracellular nuclease